MKNKKYKKKKIPSYNMGGKINKGKEAIQNMGGIASMIPGIGGAIGAGLSLASLLMPSSYAPAKQNTNVGYNKGGDIPLGNGAMEVKGNPGIDNNPRVINGSPVNLTEGEVVTDSAQGAGFVFSDSVDMIDPLTGKTFAESAKKIKKAQKKADKALEKSPYDKIAKNTKAQLDTQLEQLAQRQQQINGDNQGENLFMGGIPGLPHIWNQQLGKLRNPTTLLPSTPIKPADNVLSTLSKSKPNRPGDLLPLGLQTASLVGRGIQAAQPARQYDTSMFDVNSVRMDPTNALNQINRSYNASVYGSANTGNAAMDRTIASNAYATKLNAERDTRFQYDQANRQAIQQAQTINQANRQKMTDINEMNQGAATTARSGFLLDVETYAANLQNRDNARIHNELTMKTLNELSRYFGYDIEQVMDIINKDPERANQMLMQFKAST